MRTPFSHRASSAATQRGDATQAASPRANARAPGRHAWTERLRTRRPARVLHDPPRPHRSPPFEPGTRGRPSHQRAEGNSRRSRGQRARDRQGVVASARRPGASGGRGRGHARRVRRERHDRKRSVDGLVRGRDRVRGPLARACDLREQCVRAHARPERRPRGAIARPRGVVTRTRRRRCSRRSRL